MAVVVFQLLHEGKLRVDVPVTTYLKEPVVQRIPNADAATLRQLLNHTSGIPTWEFQPEWIRQARGNQIVPDHIWGKTETLDYIANGKAKAEFAPGSKYAYSNTNYTLLGLTVEAVTGNELTMEIRRRILEPLDMKDTFMESFESIPNGIAHRYHYATPIFVQDAGMHEYFSEIRPYLVETTFANLSPEWAAGGMVSTPSDLIHFAQALRDGVLLSSAMQKEMFTFVASGNSDDLEYMQGIARFPQEYDSMPLIGHTGGTLGFASALYWFEEIDLIISAMINVGNMHSGLNPTPFSIYLKNIFLPEVVKYQRTLDE